MSLGTEKFFLPYQRDWIVDKSPLRLCEKGRQLGLSYADSYRSVRLAAAKNARLDVWVVSRDELQARQYLLYCKRWAKVLNHACEDLGEKLIDADKNLTAHVLKFANGICIYCLSSNPDAIVGKTGHVVLDEFALHKDQRGLYAVAKPVIQWGGTLSIISTHRGSLSVFNQIIRDIREKGNPMGWSLHSIPVQKAVEQGLVEKINAASGRTETREQWLDRQRAECLDEESWQQEYCCKPSDDNAAFIGYEAIINCVDATAPRTLAQLQESDHPLYVGFDVARTQHLSVIDVEEKVGDVFWERMRVEMRNTSFEEQEFELNRLMALPQVKRCAIDATGLGKQIAERMEKRWHYRIEAVSFSAQVKSDLAYPLKLAIEQRRMRYAGDPRLFADLRGIRKVVSIAGNERFDGESGDSHCDRFWSKALALAAGKARTEYRATVVMD